MAACRGDRNACLPEVFRPLSEPEKPYRWPRFYSPDPTSSRPIPHHPLRSYHLSCDSMERPQVTNRATHVALTCTVIAINYSAALAAADTVRLAACCYSLGTR